MTRHRAGILVLCTGNSCRSQIAEAYLRRLAGDRFDVYSAGVEPAAEVHPLTRRVLEEEGFDVSGHRPKSYRDFLGRISVHYLIIVCDGAARACPAVWPGVMTRLRWPFEDPAAFEGPEDEQLERFRRVRDQIRERVEGWLASLPAAGTSPTTAG